MKEVKLSQGKVALVDDEDYEKVNQFKWCANKIGNTYYSMRYAKNRHGILMHRFIFGPGCISKSIDHIDGNGLNNQKSNLRLCNRSQNAMNSKIHSDSKTGVRGVSFWAKSKKYTAQIVLNQKRIFLGSYKTIEEATKAYNDKADELFGQFKYKKE